MKRLETIIRYLLYVPCVALMLILLLPPFLFCFVFFWIVGNKNLFRLNIEFFIELLKDLKFER